MVSGEFRRKPLYVRIVKHRLKIIDRLQRKCYDVIAQFRRSSHRCMLEVRRHRHMVIEMRI